MSKGQAARAAPWWPTGVQRNGRSMDDRGALEWLLAVSRELAACSTGPAVVERALRRVLERICEATGWELGQAWVPGADGSLRWRAGWYATARLRAFAERSKETRFEPGSGLPGRVWFSRRPEWVAGLGGELVAPRPPAPELVSALAVPVMADGRRLAVLEFFGCRSREEDEHLTELVSGVAAQLGSLLLRKEAEDALRYAEAGLRSIAEASRDGVALVDGAGRIVYLNDAIARIFGHAREAALGRPLSLLLPGLPRGSPRGDFGRAVRAGSERLLGRTVELTGVRADGSELPVELSLRAWNRPDGAVFSAVVRDISSRKRVEARLRRCEAQLADARQRASEATGRISAVDLAAVELVPPLETRVQPNDVGRLREEVRRALTERDAEASERWEAQERFQLAFDNAPIGMALVAPDGRILQVNRALCDITGYSQEQLLARRARDLVHPDDLEADRREAERMLRREIRSSRSRRRYIHADGRQLQIQLAFSLVWDADGGPRYFIAQVEDVSERSRTEDALREKRRLEEELDEARGLEMVGRLAGGVAHDFNNLMSVIISYTALVEEELADRPGAVKHMAEIRKAAERTTALTQQLVAFSRGEVVEPEVVDLNAVVEEAEDMLRRAIGDELQLTTLLARDLWRVQADVGQLQRVLLNLVVNARDAMPSGGSLWIATSNVVLPCEPATRTCDAVDPGRYVCLSVSDDGCGMPEHVSARAFEPFFTTKGPDRGAGLGLATVYGVVTEAGGTLELDSAPGEGTVVRVYLPACEGAERRAGPQRRRRSATEEARGETVLLVEDEDSVRRVVRQILSSNGYRVLDVPGPEEALAELERRPDRIDLLLTDVVMPKLSGAELAGRASALQPGLRVLFMSAYMEDLIIPQGAGEGRGPLLTKPFTPTRLLTCVRTALRSRDDASER